LKHCYKTKGDIVVLSVHSGQFNLL
jgi:hypothetical protein